jgi:hypothetical protein
MNRRRGIEQGVQFALQHDVNFAVVNSGLGMVKMS